MRLVSVVMGAQSEEARAAETQKLLTYGFRYYETLRLYQAREALNEVRVWGSARPSVKLGLAGEVAITIPRGAKDSLTAAIDIGGVFKAPISEGDVMGQLTVSLNAKTVYQGPLIALGNAAEAGLLQRLWDSLMLFVLQLFSGDPLKVV